ncbi:citryl-CoA lyase [Actinoplanes awajinensis]|uniref:citrate synthase (unknown stereospecificity) n=1 Tax=Actinoplanes awajinensis subsp. mycoplanecinus TaxID=135947 RepID=A0A101JMJ1_9ACTN|nr:citryl-CoA lyase [Actinoplanes awajinensis]KUL29675.1 citrate synthase [Actinoplanes awajinensis subsp. mycoplanecinus]
MTDSLAADWWGTAVSRIEPNRIELRGTPVQDLIGTIGFGAIIWLMLRGEHPSDPQAALLEAALVAGVDHGPHAPSIAVARMAATCGVGLNNAMASAINTLGDSHGGAGQDCVLLLDEIRAREAAGLDPSAAAAAVIAAWRGRGVRYLPGFGHRFHTRDPRRDPLLGLVEKAVAAHVVPGDHLRAALAVEAHLNAGRSTPVPMNIDGATAVIYAELGFPAPLARGLFVLSRSVGILAHAWEEMGQGRRNKGPIPPAVQPTFLG